MMRRLIPIACAAVIGMGGFALPRVGAQTAGIVIPPGAQHIAHQVLRVSHPCASNAQQTCTATITMDAYKVSTPLPAPPGAVVSSPSSVLQQIRAEHPGQHLTAAMTHGALLFRSNMRLASGCTGCGGPWYFGCPANILEHLQWDEQDETGVPLYHVAQDNQDSVNCSSAWTIWRSPSCQTFPPGWNCQTPQQSAYWDGYNHVDWVNTGTHFNPIPFVCEQDMVYTRTYTSVMGRVTAWASRTISSC